MYKKITHNISEEHFAHPLAQQIKAIVDGGAMTPMAINFAAETKLRSDARHLWTNFLWRVRGSIVSAMDNLPDAAALETQLIKDISAIGALLVPYYGAQPVAQFEQLLTPFALNIVDIAKATKAGRDTKDLVTKNATLINNLATFLGMANPKFWPATAVTTIFNKLSDAWLAQIAARSKKDWTADIAAMDHAHNALLAASTTLPSGFSEVFANGVIQQFPEKFKS